MFLYQFTSLVGITLRCLFCWNFLFWICFCLLFVNFVLGRLFGDNFFSSFWSSLIFTLRFNLLGAVSKFCFYDSAFNHGGYFYVPFFICVVLTGMKQLHSSLSSFLMLRFYNILWWKGYECFKQHLLHKHGFINISYVSHWWVSETNITISTQADEISRGYIILSTKIKRLIFHVSDSMYSISYRLIRIKWELQPWKSCKPSIQFRISRHWVFEHFFNYVARYSDNNYLVFLWQQICNHSCCYFTPRYNTIIP